MSITIIIGKPGVGKTVFATNIMANKMLNSFEDYFLLKKEIKYLNYGGFQNLSLPPQRHICYSDFKVTLSKKKQSYFVNGYEIGLPNPYFKTAFIPPYATIFLDEAQRYYDSRKNRSLRSEVYNFYQLHRQNNYTIYLICQRIGNIDVNIRSLADKIIVIENLKTKRDCFGRTTFFEWETREFESSETAEEYCSLKDKKEYKDIGKKVKVTSKLPLFNLYDSFSNKPLFFNNKENSHFDYEIEESYGRNAEDFIKFNDNHNYIAPIGYWAGTEKKIKGE